ncbi:MULTISPECIES: hypothetical protein [Streptomyces]
MTSARGHRVTRCSGSVDAWNNGGSGHGERTGFGVFVTGIDGSWG